MSKQIKAVTGDTILQQGVKFSISSATEQQKAPNLVGNKGKSGKRCPNPTKFFVSLSSSTLFCFTLHLIFRQHIRYPRSRGHFFSFLIRETRARFISFQIFRERTSGARVHCHYRGFYLKGSLYLLLIMRDIIGDFCS